MPNWAPRRWSSHTTRPSPPWPTAWSTWATEPSSAWSAMRTASPRRSCRGDAVLRSMRMKALDRKLLRDLRRMWSQALTIALVVASGLGGFVSSLSAVDSLALARERFYAQGRFADAFAIVKRAPQALAEVLRGVPGVADVQTTVEQVVRVEMAGLADPIIGQLIGMDLRHPQRMNQVTVHTGRALAAAHGAGRSDGAL